MIEAELFGDKQLKEQIKKEGTKVIPKIKFGLEQFLNSVADVARTIVPVQTGRLQSSIKYEVEEKGERAVEGRVGTNVHYGKYIELGTRKMKAKPYLVPALEKVLPQLFEFMKRAIKS